MADTVTTETGSTTPTSALNTGLDEARAHIQSLAAKASEKETSARDEAGRFVSGEKEIHADTPTKAAAGDAPKQDVPAEGKESKPGDATARDKALTALQRAKVPKSVLENLDEEMLLSWGQDLAKAQAKTDRLLKQRASESTDENRPVPDKQAKGSADLDVLLAKLGEEYGYTSDEQQVFKKINQHFTDATDLASKAAEKAAAVGRAALMQITRSQLTEQFPELKEEKVWGKVRAKALELSETDMYDDLQDTPDEAVAAVLRDASSIVLGADRRAKTSERSRARDLGQMTTSSAEGSRQKYAGLSYPMLVHRLLSEGKTPDQARRIADEVGAKI